MVRKQKAVEAPMLLPSPVPLGLLVWPGVGGGRGGDRALSRLRVAPLSLAAAALGPVLRAVWDSQDLCPTRGVYCHVNLSDILAIIHKR